MSSDSPVAILYSSDGIEVSAKNSTAIPANTGGILALGSDGTNARYISVNNSGQQIISGAGIAGTPAGGVISVQGVVGGVPLAVDGTITATNPSVGTIGVTAPTSATQIGAVDAAGNLVNLLAAPTNELITGTRSLGGAGVSNNIYVGYPQDNYSAMWTDAWGNLNTRSLISNDEGVFYDDMNSPIVQTITGTLTFTNGSDTVTATGGAFTTQLNIFNYVKLSADADSNYNLIFKVIDDNTLVLNNPYTGSSGSGTGYFTNWNLITGTGASIVQSGSYINLNSGTNTTSASYTAIWQRIDYSPISSVYEISINQRIANQTITIGIQNTGNAITDVQAVFIFTGTDNTQVTCSSQGKYGQAQATTITLPNAATTNQVNIYAIYVDSDKVSFVINSVSVAFNQYNIVPPYVDLCNVASIINTGAVTSTQISIHSVLTRDFDSIIATVRNAIPSLLQSQVSGPVLSGSPITNNYPVLIGGNDGTNSRTFLTDTSGRQILIGQGTAGTTYTSGLVTVQGTATGTPLPISGTVTANPGTGTFHVDGTGSAGFPANNVITVQGIASGTSINVAQATAGNLNATVVGSGNFTVVQSIANNLNAAVIGLGTAGAPEAHPITIQGITGGTSVNIAQATAGNLNATVISNSTAGTTYTSGLFTIQGTATGVAVPISGTITANIGTTNGLALNTTLTGGTQLTQIGNGTNTVSIKAASTQAVVADPSLVVQINPNQPAFAITANAGTGNFNVIGTNTAGTGYTTGLITIQGSASGVAVPVSGTVTANIGTTNGLALNATLTSGSQLTQIGNGTNSAIISNGPAGTEYGLITRNIPYGTQTVSITGTPAVTITSGTTVVTQPTAANLNATVVGSGNFNVVGVGTAGSPLGGVVSIQGVASGTAIPVSGSVAITGTPAVTITSGTTVVTQATASNLNAAVIGTGTAGTPATGVVTVQGIASGTALPASQSGTWNVGLSTGANTIGIVNQGLAATLANAWSMKLTDASNGPVAVKPASTAAVVGDASLVVQISPNQTAVPISGTVTATNPSVGTIGAAAPTSAGYIGLLNGSNLIGALGDSSGRLVVTGAGIAGTPAGGVVSVQGVASGQPLIVSQATAANLNATVTGTITANIGTTNGLALNATLTGGTQLTQIGNGTNSAIISNGPAGTEYGLITRNIPYGTQTVSGSGSFTVAQATAANLNATVVGSGNFNVVGVGSAGTPSGGVVSIQGVASGTVVPVSGSVSITGTPAVTVSSGSITVTQGTAANLLATVSQGGTWTVGLSTGANTIGIINQGLAATLANAWSTKITDATNGPVAVKAASTAAVVGDPSLVVQISPNQPSFPVSISNSPAVTITSGTTVVTQATAANLNATVVGTGTAGSTYTTGVFTIQGTATGTPIPITGSITASNASVGLTGSASPTSASLSGGTDGTNLRALSVTTAGILNTQGPGTAGSVYTTGVMTIQGTTTGTPIPITGSISATNPSVGTTGSAVPASATMIAGTNGTNLTTITATTAGTSISTGVLTIQGNASGVPIPITGSITATNAAVGVIGSAAPTSASYSGLLNGSNLIGALGDSAGRTVIVGAGTAGASVGGVLSIQGVASGTPMPITGSISANPTPDNTPATQNITVVDSGSTSNTYANGQVFITGTPTANSAASFSYTSWDNANIQVTGTWTGSLRVETSVDGGTTWFIHRGHQYSIDPPNSTFTNNFVEIVHLAATTNIRVRAISAMTGTATVLIVQTKSDAVTYNIGPSRISDNAGNGPVAVKPASTQAVSADPALVVQINPNQPTFPVTATISGTPAVTITSGTTVVTQPTAANLNATVIGAGSAGAANAGVVTVQGIASMTPIQVSQASAGNLNATVVGSGNFTVVQATATNLNAAVVGIGTAGTPSGGVVSVQGVVGGVAQPISGSVSITGTPAVTITSGTTVVTQPTAANLNATVIGAGSAGSANAGVMTVQGIASMTPLIVSQATAGNLNATVVGSGNFNVIGTGTAGAAAAGVITVQGIAGGTTIPVTATISGTPAVTITSGTTVVTQTTASNLNAAVVGVGTAGTPSGGVLTVQGSGSGTALPISGSVSISSGTTTVTQGSAASLNATVVGSGNFTVVQATASNLNAAVVGTGTAGTPATGVLSVQGISSGTALSVVTKSSTATLTNVASSATNAVILASNTSRLGAIIFNDSTAALYLKFGVTASTSSFTTKIFPGDVYQLLVDYTGELDGIWASANGFARVTELT
jgi:hypothetical protein